MKKRRRTTSVPLTREDLVRQLDDLAATQARVFTKDGRVPMQMFILRSGQRPVTIGYGYDSSRMERKLGYERLQRLRRREECAVGQILENWYLQQKPGAPFRLPSTCPDRRECILICGESSLGVFAWQCEIKRAKDGKGILGDWDRCGLGDDLKLEAFPEDEAESDDIPKGTANTFDSLIEYAAGMMQRNPQMMNDLWLDLCCERAGLTKDEWNRMSEAQRLQVAKIHMRDENHDRDAEEISRKFTMILRRKWSAMTE
jgi:hypothetical protein